jgi:hypothetical protein
MKKTVRLPILRSNFSTRKAMDTLVTHRVGGAVVKRGTGYDFVTLDDVAKGFSAKKRVSLAKIKHMKLNLDYVARVEGETLWVHAKLGTSLGVRFSAPLYACPKRDYSQTAPGTCPFHEVPLEIVKKGA